MTRRRRRLALSRRRCRHGGGLVACRRWRFGPLGRRRFLAHHDLARHDLALRRRFGDRLVARARGRRLLVTATFFGKALAATVPRPVVCVARAFDRSRRPRPAEVDDRLWERTLRRVGAKRRRLHALVAAPAPAAPPTPASPPSAAVALRVIGFAAPSFAHRMRRCSARHFGDHVGTKCRLAFRIRRGRGNAGPAADVRLLALHVDRTGGPRLAAPTAAASPPASPAPSAAVVIVAVDGAMFVAGPMRRRHVLRGG